MPIHNVWLIEDRISLGYFEGAITMQNLLDSQAESTLMYEGVEGSPLHAVMDMRHVTKYPTNLSELIRGIPLYKSQEFGWVMVITTNAIIRFLGSTVVQLSKQRFRAFTDVQQCLNFLNEIDESLPHLTEEAYYDTIRAIELK